jgi:hypothetical protein
MESEGRRLQISGDKETDIANGILRVSMAVQQTVCFLDGHRSPTRSVSKVTTTWKAHPGIPMASAPNMSCTNSTAWPKRATPWKP